MPSYPLVADSLRTWHIYLFDLPIKNCDFPSFFVCLSLCKNHIIVILRAIQSVFDATIILFASCDCKRDPNLYLGTSKSIIFSSVFPTMVVFGQILKGWVFINGFSGTFESSGRVQQCHLHHPPVITIFTGGINHSKWVVKMVLFYLHPIDTAIFGALVEARRHTLAMTAVVAIERWRPWDNFWTTEVWGTKPLDWFGGFTWYALICWAIIGWFPVLASGFAGIQTDI